MAIGSSAAGSGVVDSSGSGVWSSELSGAVSSTCRGRDSSGDSSSIDRFSCTPNSRNYFGNLIERFSGEKRKFLFLPLKGKTIEKAKIVPFLSELNKLIGGSYIADDAPDFDERLEQVISPMGTTLKDKEDMVLFGILDKEAKLKGSYNAGLESLYKQYMKKNIKNPDEKIFMDNVKQLEYLLKREGLTDLNLLQIKIKATQAAIQEQIQEKIRKEMSEFNKKKEQE